MSRTTFGIRPGKRVEVIIDGAHTYHLCRNLGFELDFAALRTILYDDYDCRTINYIIKVAFDDHGEIQQPIIAKMLDYLRYNGHKPIITELKEWTTTEGRRVVRHNVDMTIACTMLKAAARGIDEIIVFSASDDLIPAVETAQDLGARITLVSSVTRQSHMISNDLRAAADWFVDLADAKIKERLIRREREPREHREREPQREMVADPNVQPAEAVVIEDRRETSFGARMRVNPRRASS